MLKRQALIVSLCFCLILCAVIPVTASAAENDTNSGWLDVLQYATLEDGANSNDGPFFPLAGYQPFGVMLPVETTLYGVDMILSMDGNINLSQLEIQFVWHDSGAYTSLTVIHIGENLYRAYGAVPDGNYNAFDIRFWNYDGQTYYIDVKTLRVQTVETNSFREIGNMQMSSAGGTTSGKMLDDDTAFPIVQYWSESTEFNCSVWCNDWIKYDYLEFVLTSNVDSILSISSYDSSGHNFPTTVSYFDNDGGGRTSFIVRIDFTGVDRTQNNYFPNILIRGLASQSFSMTLHSVTGHVKIVPPAVEKYWYEKLFDKLGEWFGNVTDSVSNSIGGLLEQEKQEALEQGNASVGELENAVPDLGGQFTGSIEGFSNAFSYDGTDAVLAIPALALPEIPGLIPETTLMEDTELDFGQIFALLPEGLVLLVQSLLTIALILFCFKELYGTISYILTLKRDGG